MRRIKRMKRKTEKKRGKGKVEKPREKKKTRNRRWKLTANTAVKPATTHQRTKSVTWNKIRSNCIMAD